MRLRNDEFGTWRRVRLALGGLLLLTVAGACAPEEPAPGSSARLTSVERDVPHATSTTAERISTTASTEAPTTTTEAPTTTVRPTTTTAPPVSTTTTAPPVPTTTAAPPPTTSAAASSSTYYANCDAARAAGAAPLHTGDPGYRSGLDRDHDGVACE